MSRIAVLLILAILLPMVSAQVSLPAWSWDKYVGLSQWKVTVTEDESDCGGGVTTSKSSMPIQHNLTTAVVEDLHGTVTGTFISGNILHIPARTVPDSPGTSEISDYDLFFTTDCSSFAGEYTWDYSGSDGACSGSTTLSGTNNQGCPAPTDVPVIPPVEPPNTPPSMRQEISDARIDLDKDLAWRSSIEADYKNIDMYKNLEGDIPGSFDSLIAPLSKDIKDKEDKISQTEPTLEAKYQAILDKDPNNFWANWDMAQLKKSQGKYDDFSTYFDTAVSNKNIYDDTKFALKQKVAEDLGLTTLPTVEKSLTINRIANEVSGWGGGKLWNVPVPEDTNKQTFGIKLYSIFSSNSWNIVNEIAGLPGN